MSSDSSSIETPVLIVRTFAWLRTSLLKGMSRVAARVIFWVLVILIFSMTGGQEPLSRPLKPVTEPKAFLFLSRAPRNARARAAPEGNGARWETPRVRAVRGCLDGPGAAGLKRKEQSRQRDRRP
jgi:hypothetical protein